MRKLLTISSVIVVFTACCFGLVCGIYLLIMRPSHAANPPADGGGGFVCPWCGYPQPADEHEFWWMRDESLKLREATDDQKERVIKLASKDAKAKQMLKKAMSDGMLSVYEAGQIEDEEWYWRREFQRAEMQLRLSQAAGVNPTEKAEFITPYSIRAKREHSNDQDNSSEGE